MNRREIAVGIAGYGWVSGAHIAAIRAIEGARVAAICTSRDTAAAEIAAQFGSEVRVYRSYEQMLEDPVLDVISVCSYHALHADQAVAAARAGKHLIIEKPLALTWNDCLRVRAAVREAEVRVCVCFECRFSSQFEATRSVVQQGLLGRVHYAEVDYYHGIGPWYRQFDWNVRSGMGGSSLLTAGCHALDGLLFLMGGEVESVSSFGTRSANGDFAKYEYDTSTVTLVRFADGRVGKVTSCIDCLQPYYFHVHLVGSEGSLLDNRFHSSRVTGLNRARWSDLSIKLLDSGDVTDHPYEVQFRAFFDALREDCDMPRTSLHDALVTHRVVFASDLAAWSGRVVALEEIDHT